MGRHPAGFCELDDPDDNQATYCDRVGGDSVEGREVGRAGFGDLAQHYVTNGEWRVRMNRGQAGGPCRGGEVGTQVIRVRDDLGGDRGRGAGIEGEGPG